MSEGYEVPLSYRGDRLADNYTIQKQSPAKDRQIREVLKHTASSHLTHMSGVVPKSTAEMDAEVMGLGMLHSVWQREELLRVRPVDRAPVIRLLSRTIASICG